jgi:hypothetical protein
VGVEGSFTPGSDDNLSEWARRIVVKKTGGQAPELTRPAVQSVEVVRRKIDRFRRRREPGGGSGGVIENPQNNRPTIEVNPPAAHHSARRREKGFVESSCLTQVRRRNEHAEYAGCPTGSRQGSSSRCAYGRVLGINIEKRFPPPG